MKLFHVFVVWIIAATNAVSQELNFPAAATQSESGLTAYMPELAKQVIALHTAATTEQQLLEMYRVQIIAGEFNGAQQTILDIEKIYQTSLPARSTAMLTPDRIFALALIEQARTGINLSESIANAFRATFSQLDNKQAFDAAYWLWAPLSRLHDRMMETVSQQNNSGHIELSRAIELVQQYELYIEYQQLLPLVDDLIAADDHNRYDIKDIIIPTSQGGQLSAIVVRDKKVTVPQPATVNFTLYSNLVNNLREAKDAAVHGYVGVVVDARGKRLGTGNICPWECEAQDTYNAIDWISKQTWSNGKVGMYGHSYSGFASWAAVKHVHPALMTIVPTSASNPAWVLPMQNNVFQNANYQWAFHVMHNKYTDESVYADNQRWDSLFKRWYERGERYRNIDKLDNEPNALLQRQLQHPNYDAYWQSMTPYAKEYANIRIPILQITGYFDPAQVAALHYLREHYRYNPKAEHYLVIGPYDHIGAKQGYKPDYVNGYHIDPAAQFDTPELVFQWMDYVMRGGEKPRLLKDKINYEVMGANTWNHAPLIKAMSKRTRTLYLSNQTSADKHLLSEHKPPKSAFIEQVIDFADRTTTNNLYPSAVLAKDIAINNALAFISEPLDKPMSISGNVTGLLRTVINKRDMDITMACYEIMSDGQAFNLSYYLGRASYARDMRSRKLLNPGKLESIPIDTMMLVNRQLTKGSRLLVLLTINKNPYAQINYGTGKDVSDESIADATTPLRVQWRNDSYIQFPMAQ